MRKERDQRLFQKDCLEIASNLRVICSKAYHGLGNWTDFLEKMTVELKKFQKLFEDLK